jgi:hypothetical protein
MKMSFRYAAQAVVRPGHLKKANLARLWGRTLFIAEMFRALTTVCCPPDHGFDAVYDK